MASKIKRTWHLSRPEAAELLRKLADTLQEGGDEVEQFGISLAELAKFQIKIDLGFDDSLEVKFSGKGFKICGTEEECGSGVLSERYSSVKKRMQVYFKALRESVTKAEMPSREIVAVFLSDSEKMISFKGYGDEFYPGYAELCEKLRQGMDAEDMAEIHFAIIQLDKAKKACHARYK